MVKRGKPQKRTVMVKRDKPRKQLCHGEPSQAPETIVSRWSETSPQNNCVTVVNPQVSVVLSSLFFRESEYVFVIVGSLVEN
jgi:hypothetical protein